MVLLSFLGQTFGVGMKKLFNPLINIDCDYFDKLGLQG